MSGALVIAASALTACNQIKPSKPIDVHCDPICFVQCEALTPWDGDRDGKRLTALFDAHDVEHSECDLHRAACVNCINAARAAHAIQ
jgi:hypothetical protein